ncbi:MAG: TonB-dependent receptor, partial [Gemmatimonas sp.]|nr:TonB-dependent receptor [Gemmatimonas sp.]
AFDAVRTWTPLSWGTESAFLTLNPGNDDLGPERSREVEAGFESAILNDRLTIDFTAYHQRTADALLSVNTAPSAGDWASQLQNVGELRNRGIEVSVNGSLIRNANYQWDVGVNYSSNESEVVSLGGAPEFGTGGGTRIAEGYPVPVVRGDRILNPDEKAPIEYEQNHFYGPNTPTTIVTPSTTITLPGQILITARGEYQEGHFVQDGATTWSALTGAPLPPCFDAYVDIDAGNLDNLTAMERAWCVRENHRSGFYVYPADFFKLRELSLQVPVTRFVPGSTRSTLTVSGRNLFRWVKDEFRGWDPEAGGWNSSNSFASQIWENPAPGKILTASLRVSF